MPPHTKQTGRRDLDQEHHTPKQQTKWTPEKDRSRIDQETSRKKERPMYSFQLSHKYIIVYFTLYSYLFFVCHCLYFTTFTLNWKDWIFGYRNVNVRMWNPPCGVPLPPSLCLICVRTLTLISNLSHLPNLPHNHTTTTITRFITSVTEYWKKLIHFFLISRDAIALHHHYRSNKPVQCNDVKRTRKSTKFVLPTHFFIYYNLICP